MKAINLPAVLVFDWDRGNSMKNWIRHKISIQDQEEAFLEKRKLLIEDKKHSQFEKRFILLSKTKKGQKLIIAFTIRVINKQKKIRPISTRTMNRKEAKIYEETIKLA
jgi:uncharacterized protein